MENRESEEMYLETILLLKKKEKIVRSVDIVNERGFAKSSVSRAVNLLQKRGYIVIDRISHNIIFTEKGEEKANDIYDRHRILTKMLIQFGANEKLAEENACSIEHVVTDEMFKLIKKQIDK